MSTINSLWVNNLMMQLKDLGKNQVKGAGGKERTSSRGEINRVQNETIKGTMKQVIFEMEKQIVRPLA